MSQSSVPKQDASHSQNDAPPDWFPTRIYPPLAGHITDPHIPADDALVNIIGDAAPGDLPEDPLMLPAHPNAAPDQTAAAAQQDTIVWVLERPPSFIGNGIATVPQDPYCKGIPTTNCLDTVQYQCFSLQSALDEEYASLHGWDQLAWIIPSTWEFNMSPKLGIVLCFPGYPPHYHQVTVLRSRSRSPLRGKLATIVAREMERFLNKARDEYRRPLRCGGKDLALCDLTLIDVQHVSRGSLQPTLGFVTYGAHRS